MAMTLSISILGPLVIESGDYRLGKVPKKARALLAFLAAQADQPVTRERLADLLRPLVRPQQVGQSLASNRLVCLGCQKRKQSACLLRNFSEAVIATLDHQRSENADRQRHRHQPNVLVAAPRRAVMDSDSFP